jgi:hypothetical protein
MLRAPTRPRTRRLTCRASQSYASARRLELTVLQPRMPSIGLMPTLRLAVADQLKNIASNMPHDRNTLTAQSQPPACHGDGMPFWAASPRAIDAETTVTRGEEDASRQSLQPTCCQRAPLKLINSRTEGSHRPAYLRRLRTLAQYACTGVESGSSEPVPDSPKASPTSSGTAIGVACTSRVHHHPQLRQLCQSPPPFCFGRRTPWSGVFFPRTDRATWPPTLHVMLCRLEPTFVGPGDATPRTCFTAAHQMPLLPRTEAPSTDGSRPPRSLLALRA